MSETAEIYVVIFLLADEAYCIPVSSVQEIQSYRAHPSPRKVPNTPPFFEGIIDLRGQVIPILDIRQRFQMDAAEVTRKTCYIIVDMHNEKIGLLVDAVVEVQRVHSQSFQAPPARMKVSVNRDFVLGVGKLAAKSADYSDEKRLVILLDIEKLIEPSEMPNVS